MKNLHRNFWTATIFFLIACSEDNPNNAVNTPDVPQGGNEIACDATMEGAVFQPAGSEYPRLCQSGMWIDVIPVIPDTDPGSPSSSSIILSEVEGSSSSSNVTPSSSSSVRSNSSSLIAESSSCSEASSSSNVTPSSSSSVRSSSSSLIAESSSCSEVMPSSSSNKESSSSAMESSSSIELSSSSQIISSSSSVRSSSSMTSTVKSIYDAENNTLTDLRDNQVYRTVTIGDQIWMAENLNYKYKDKTKSFCYEDSTKYCDLYGRLYSKDVKNIALCPNGWHVPNSLEWEILFSNTGNKNGPLKATSSWSDWDAPGDCNGSDEYGFSIYAAGKRSYTSFFVEMEVSASFFIRDKSLVVYINRYNQDAPSMRDEVIVSACSIRCIKDSD